METNPSLDFGAEAIFQTPLNIVAKEAANQQAGFWACQGEVCQVIQLGSVRGLYSWAIFTR